MSIAFWISYIFLWAVALGALALSIVSVRQIGLVYLSRYQATTRDGLPLDSTMPSISASRLSGEAERVNTSGTPALVVIGSAGCGPCRRLLESAHDDDSKQLVQQSGIRLLFLSTDDPIATEPLASIAPSSFEFLCVSDSVVKDLRVRVTPFAFLVNELGQVKWKGVLNHIADMAIPLGLTSESTVPIVTTE